MTPDQAMRRLSEIEPGRFAQLSRLAAEIAKAPRDAASAVARMWASGSPAERAKAAAVLVGLRERSLQPLLPPETAEDGGQRLARLQVAADAYLAARGRAIRSLSVMMASKAPLPPVPGAGKTEEKEPDSRECDEAYLATRRLLKTDDTQMTHQRVRRAFLQNPRGQRDAEIGHFRDTGKWKFSVAEEPGTDDKPAPR